LRADAILLATLNVARRIARRAAHASGRMRLQDTNRLLRTLAACALLLACHAGRASAQNHAPHVTKIEPPSWWAGHTINPVRLLVRGRDLKSANVAAEPGAPFEVFGQTVNRAGTYIFVNLRINPDARPGEYRLIFSSPAGVARLPFRINEPLDRARNFQGITTDDIVYLIMPDRFANGDTSNDAPADAPPEANDRRNARAWHGGDLRGVINRLPYLKELGVTALWLNPWQDNWNGINRCDKPWCPSTYYHGYHAIDYYGVEDRFGTLETLRELVERSHAVGIKVIQDQVANHVVVKHPWAAEAPLDNWFHGSVAKHLLNPFRGDLLLSPHAHETERRPTLDGWFADDMPDMNQEEPEVARYEIQNALWWVGVTGMDGIRQDTVQYMPRAFIRDLSRALRAEYPRAWMVGEVFDRDPAHVSYFLGGRTGWDGIDTELVSVFDFPLWQASLDVFTGKSPARRLRDALKYDGLYTDAHRLTTMANNHDVRRFMSLEGATPEGSMMHVAFTLSVRGTPQLYYGEEIAMEGGDDPDNRRDFPGGFPGDARDAFTREGRTPAEQRMFEWTRDWIRLRREHPAIRRGRHVDLFYDDDSYAFARAGEGETVVLVFNRSAAPKQITLPASALEARDGARLLPLLVAKDAVTVAAGKATLTAPPRTAVAYRVSEQ
jgi:neopullulanase